MAAEAIVGEAKSRARPRAARDAGDGDARVRRFDEGISLGAAVNADPAFDDFGPAEIECAAGKIEDIPIHAFRRKIIHGRAVMVRIADDQRAIGALYDDQMNPIRQNLRSFLLQLCG